MLEIVNAFIEQHCLLPESGYVVVAVSGGADSLCLLHLLQQLCGSGKRFPLVRLHVAHLNHQLRGQASVSDAETVALLAASWGLPCTIGTVDVPALARREQRSLEDAARTARYRFLREVAQGFSCSPDSVCIAVAHQLDDQVETLLLHWLRGGGIASMIGLQPRQQDIIRPLLTVTRAETLAYCQCYQLVPLEDASNADTRFLRNRIRHELLPVLEAMNPGMRATLLRSAEVMQVDAEWIELQVDAAWPGVVVAEHTDTLSLALSALLALPLSIQRHLLRRVTSKLSAGQSPLELRHYRLIEQLMHREYTRETVTLHLPHQLHIMRLEGTLTFKRITQYEMEESAHTHEEVRLLVPGHVDVSGTPWVALAEIVPETLVYRVREAIRAGCWEEVWSLLPSARYTVYIDGGTVGNAFHVRTRRPGDRIRPLGMMHEKKVQDVLIDKHVERVERMSIPLFFSSAHCVWLAGVYIDDRVRITQQTQRIIKLSLLSKTCEA